ncbi:NUDIX hydrolase [Streptomyces sp. NRRL F-5126]|uniref:NUDIX hydrolase n=1 Tax=Streptomyces sp. NRRL F-5126 TaxID=1463857 RepID=UPI0004C843EE|nr:NUDIX domain-containing protein [Streptomyces sp. NRRL F-5126]
MATTEDTLDDLLATYRPRTPIEAEHVRAARALATAAPDPWSRALPLHATASALIVHPPTRRVLLRWHARLGAWLQVGGHGDPGESAPLAIALREAREETGLADLEPWPDASPRHVAVVPVPAGGGEPAHEHADLRFVFATADPGSARRENAEAPLCWLGIEEARERTAQANVRESLARAAYLLTAAGGSGRV